MRFLKAFLFSLISITGAIAYADEGGVSFWVPGFFGSLAAAPREPGFSFTNVFYHTDVTGGSEIAFARQVPAGHIRTNFTGNLDLDLQAKADVYYALPTYTFYNSFLGGQAGVSLAIPYGRSWAEVNATLSDISGLSLGKARSQQVTGFGDMAWLANVRWNEGVHNYMAYGAGNLTVGVYDPDNLTNLGLNHNSLDAGGGYTYYNTKTGHEFSTVVGFTYNFKNRTTQYQNGIDLHMDASASKFFAKKIQVGVVGYAYQQLSCDSGAGDKVGCFPSRTFGIGPQIGYIIPGQTYQTYLNLKEFSEFEANHRPSGWNAWLTLSISPSPKLA